VRAVVLVGGEGTRLRPLTLTTPKQMLPVGGRPMIERVLEGLAVHGIDEAVLSLGYRPDAFIEAYPDGKCAGVRLHYAVEPEPLDTAGAISFAARDAGLRETFVVANGDVLTGLDVGALIRFHADRGAEATIALTPVEDPSRFGVVPTDAQGRVIAFIEKPPPDEAPTNLINAGTYVLEASVVDRVPTGRRVSIEREIFPAMVAEGHLFALACDGDWVDAGTPATYLAANLRYAGPPPASCRVAPGASVQSSVVGEGVVIAEGASVVGSVLLDGVSVGARAQVRASIVGRNSRIGDGAEIGELTVVGDGATVEAGSVVRGARIPEVQ
jgi:mannose-1-phosphate guanylyltransferase